MDPASGLGVVLRARARSEVFAGKAARPASGWRDVRASVARVVSGRLSLGRAAALRLVTARFSVRA
ncbi:MAG: hypothetical protein WA374_02365, partial [Acidobacteriaceae bacterium]